MKPYASYKPSGVSWLGDVPGHWSGKRLRDCVESCSNGVWGDEPDGGEDDIPVIRVADFDRNRRQVVEYETLRKVESGQRESRLLLSGDMLMEKSGGGEQQPVGMVVSYLAPEDAVCSNFVARMRSREGVVSRFMVYLHAYLYASRVTNISVKQTTGIQNLDSTAYLSEACFVPPPDEQQAIADHLDTETARINTLIHEKDELRGLLKEARSSRISELVSGDGLPGSPTGNPWAPHLPKSWQFKRLKHLAQVRSGLAKGKESGGNATVELPYLRVANVQEGRLDLREISTMPVEVDAVERFSLVEGDVLMNEGGDYDKVGRGAMWTGEISPCLHQNHVFAVRPVERDLSEWLSAITQTQYAKFYFMNNAKQSTNLASISQTTVKELPILLPPKAQRDALLRMLGAELAAFDNLIAHTNDEIGLLKELRAATIADAVLGRIDVRTARTTPLACRDTQ